MYNENEDIIAAFPAAEGEVKFISALVNFLVKKN